MTKKKAKRITREAVREHQPVAPDVLQQVGIEFHDLATCACEECAALRLKMAAGDRKAA